MTEVRHVRCGPRPGFPECARWRPHPWHGLETGPEPPSLVHVFGRRVHDCSTYNLRPGPEGRVAVVEPYGRAHAEAVVRASIEDYREALDRARDV